jgi:hypothetical protein
MMWHVHRFRVASDATRLPLYDEGCDQATTQHDTAQHFTSSYHDPP